MAQGAAVIDDLVASLVVGAPTLQGRWQSYREGDEYLPDQHFVSIGQLAAEVARVAPENFGEVTVFFRNLEDALIARSDQRLLLVVGLLEGLQNVGFSFLRDPVARTKLFGPTTERYWDDLVSLWGGTMTSEEFDAAIEEPSSASPPSLSEGR